MLGDAAMSEFRLKLTACFGVGWTDFERKEEVKMSNKIDFYLFS